MALKRALFVIALCFIGAGAASAFSAENQRQNREAAMKKIDSAMGSLAAIAKGEKPYDSDVIKASLTTISETIMVFPDYFPEGSENDDEKASPEIWAENKRHFWIMAEELAADADALLAHLPADQDAVRAALDTLGQSCNRCHELSIRGPDD